MKLMNDEFGFVILVLIIAALPAAIFVITLFVKLIGFFRNVFSGETEYEATVLKKEERDEVRGGRSSTRNSNHYYNIPYRVYFYFITFKTPKHKKLKLKVDSEAFRAVKEGDIGILTLQGKKYIGFEKKAEGSFYG